MLEETFPTKRRLHGQVLGSQSSIVFTTICSMNDCGPEARANQATLRTKQGEYLSERSTTTFPDIQLANTPDYRNGPTFREIMLKLKHPFKPNTPLLNCFHRDIFNPRSFKAIHNINDSSLVVELRAMLPHIIRRDMPHIQDSTYKWLGHTYWENADKRYPQDPHLWFKKHHKQLFFQLYYSPLLTVLIVLPATLSFRCIVLRRNVSIASCTESVVGVCSFRSFVQSKGSFSLYSLRANCILPVAVSSDRAFGCLYSADSTLVYSGNSSCC
jgi:hypothetical protein